MPFSLASQDPVVWKELLSTYMLLASKHPLKLRCLIFLWMWVLIQAPVAMAQGLASIPITISSSPIPVGSGARAAGVGNAFIALADDATAASWNPAGLIQLERPELSGVGAFFMRRDEYGDVAHSFETGDTLFLQPGTNTTESLDVNFLSLALPFHFLRHNVTVSLNYQKQFDFNRELDLEGRKDFVKPNSPDEVLVRTDLRSESKQEGSLYALTPALAIQITPAFSVGVAVNIWSSMFFRDTAWSSEEREIRTIYVPDGDPLETTVIRSSIKEDFHDFTGLNATFGLLWNIRSDFSFGAVVELPFRANMEADLEFTSHEITGENPAQSYTVNRKIKMDFPISYGVGLAYRPMDKLTLSLDYMRVEWEDFVYWDESGQKYSVVTGEETDEDGNADVDATDAVRLGVEYLFLYPEAGIAWPIRAGAFYEPEPAKGPPNTFVGFSLGTGVAFERVSFDVAYVYKFGNDIHPETIVGIRTIPEASEDVQQHSILFSSIFMF